MEQEMTGYPSIDRPWMKFYSKEACKTQLPEATIYEFLCSHIQGHLNTTAIDYFGTKISYKEFLHHIDEYASTFAAMGIQAGDVVSIAAPNLPEVFYSIYGLNKIGAIVNLIDPRNNAERIKLYINQSGSTKLIMLDIVYPKIKHIVRDTALTDVYTISASQSLRFPLNILQNIKTKFQSTYEKCPANGIYQPLSSLLKKYRHIHTSLNNTMKYDDVAVIINTSGTTGTPKGVQLTNDNLNAVVYDCGYSGMDLKEQDIFLGIMPCFLSYGIGVGVHMPFSLGLTNVIIPSFSPKSFGKLIRKYKPTHFAGVPSHFQYMMEDPKMEGVDLSFIKTPVAGGDAMDAGLKQKTNNFLAAHGCTSKVKVGYGCTENTGLASTQIYVGESNEENELTTVGIPALYSNFAVWDQEKHTFLKYNEPGELLISGRGVMRGYINNPEETATVVECIDGTDYIHTGDVGRIDENGCVYVLGRIKRIIVRPDGHNVFPSYIENVASKHPEVKACVCIGGIDPKHVNGRIPVAYIQLHHSENSEQVIEELKKMTLEELPERDVALDYVIIDEIPMTPNGKADFRLLEEMYNSNAV